MFNRLFDTLVSPVSSVSTTSDISDSIRNEYEKRFLLSPKSYDGYIPRMASTSYTGLDEVYTPITEPKKIWKCGACGTKHNIEKMNKAALVCEQCGSPLIDPEEEE